MFYPNFDSTDGDCQADSLCFPRGFLAASVPQNKAKLIPAIACHGIRALCGRGKQTRDFDYDLVASGQKESCVDFVETVEIDCNKRKRQSKCACTGILLRQAATKAVAIAQARQWVE